MKQYAGLDVSLKEISICIVDREGKIIARGSTIADPEAIVDFFAEENISPQLMVHESGPLSIWLQRGLERLSQPAICIDARKAHKALSARLNKSDASDAEGLAQLARTGWFTRVHLRSEAAEGMRALLGARDRLIRLRKDLEGHVRGVLKTFGIRMIAVNKGRLRQGFRDQLADAGDKDPVLATIAGAFIVIHETLCTAAEALDKELLSVARKSTLCRRLMTIPGIGPIVGLSFIAHVDDASRFRKAADVGAFLGLTPRRHQSGEVDYSGRISKCGDVQMRGLLFEAATSLIRLVRRFSPLKAWAVRLAARKGFKKAAVATARKMAVLMLTLWKNETEFCWKGTSTA